MRLRATYRLQLGPDLDFAAAKELVPYLRELGISHLYLSPSLQAASGSTHGYDVVDPTRISSQLGGEKGLRELADAGLGIVLDIVPNHMGAGEENPWWADPALRARFFDVERGSGLYRRFFDVDGLAAVREEDDEVFEVMHGKVLALVNEGVLDGLRIDHPDGLADPAGYLRRLRERGAGLVWVEKILSSTPPGERMRDWPVAGTVGYDFLNDVAALFVDPAGEAALTELWTDISGDARGFHEIGHEAKLEQASATFARELAWLERLAPRFGESEIAEALASLPIYRTYVEPASGDVDPADVAAVEASSASSGLRDALLLRDRGGVEDGFVVRFQQTSPAVAAKGEEDTAFYRYLRLLALNDVGGDPARFSLSVESFHAHNLERSLRFPQALLATQTHDTKRSGDARARIGAIAAVASSWRQAVTRWRAISAPLREDDEAGPDPIDEYFIYQTLVGVWPIEPERLDAYLVKALREAKRHTRWVGPNEVYENGVRRFAAAVLEHEPFVADFERFMDTLLPEGERSALGQLALKLSAPGVADIYQGDELWSLSLVDPDNRRAVDWEARRAALERVLSDAAPAPQDRKLFLIRRALQLRARRPEPFAGGYLPLAAGDAVCAFLRGEAEVLVAVALRGAAGGEEVSLELPPVARGRWRDVLGGDEAELGGSCTLADFKAAIGGIWLLERV
ncbi:MAG TPA: malto-oligosyltrehalose synthase [Solirubrobacteraceae bacterium]